MLLTGDQSYVGVLRKQIDLIYQQKKVENGKTLLPQMYGDPRGFKHNGKPEFYHYTGNLFLDRLTEIYLWSMDRRDLERIPADRGWIGFLEGKNPTYPEKEMADDFEHIRKRMELMRNDQTSPDTRLADYLQGIVPATTDTLVQLTLGGYFAAGRIWVLHSRLRYFDPEKRRSCLPEGVAALVEKLTADSVTVTLVNTNQIEPRVLDVQAGGYGEHQFTAVSANGKNTPFQSSIFTVRLARAPDHVSPVDESLRESSNASAALESEYSIARQSRSFLSTFCWEPESSLLQRQTPISIPASHHERSEKFMCRTSVQRASSLLRLLPPIFRRLRLIQAR